MGKAGPKTEKQAALSATEPSVGLLHHGVGALLAQMRGHEGL